MAVFVISVILPLVKFGISEKVTGKIVYVLSEGRHDKVVDMTYDFDHVVYTVSERFPYDWDITVGSTMDLYCIPFCPYIAQTSRQILSTYYLSGMLLLGLIVVYKFPSFKKLAGAKREYETDHA